MGDHNSGPSLFEMTPRQHFDEGVEFGRLETNLRHWTAAIPSLPSSTADDLIERVKDAFGDYAKLADFYDMRNKDVCEAVRPYLSAEDQARYGLAPKDGNDHNAIASTAELDIPEEDIPF